MENWRRVFREGVLPLLSEKEAAALRKGLADGDPELVRGRVSESRFIPDGRGYSPLPCHGACLCGYAGWKGGPLETCGEVEEFFDEIAKGCAERCGHASIRHLTGAWDEADAVEGGEEFLRRELVAEIDLAFAEVANVG